MFIILSFLFSSLINAETTTTQPSSGAPQTAQQLMVDKYPPTSPVYVDVIRGGHKAMLKVANANWKKLSIDDQFNYLLDSYEDILQRRGLTDVFKASDFACLSLVYGIDPKPTKKKGSKTKDDYTFLGFHHKAPGGRTSQAGIGGMTRELAHVTFHQSDFRSVVSGFENIRDGKIYHQKMAGSMLAQMDLLVGHMEYKRKWVKSYNGGQEPELVQLMQRYFGSNSPRYNGFSKVIGNCSRCIQRGNKNCLENYITKMNAQRGLPTRRN